VLHVSAVPLQRDLKRGQGIEPMAGVAGRKGVSRPDEQRPVQCEGGNGVRWRKPPTRKYGLHDLEPVRDPRNAGQQSAFVHVGLWSAREAEHDLRLNARLDHGV
jgi:hypothetical protein